MSQVQIWACHKVEIRPRSKEGFESQERQVPVKTPTDQDKSRSVIIETTSKSKSLGAESRPRLIQVQVNTPSNQRWVWVWAGLRLSQGPKEVESKSRSWQVESKHSQDRDESEIIKKTSETGPGLASKQDWVAHVSNTSWRQKQKWKYISVFLKTFPVDMTGSPAALRYIHFCWVVLRSVRSSGHVAGCSCIILKTVCRGDTFRIKALVVAEVKLMRWSEREREPEINRVWKTEKETELKLWSHQEHLFNLMIKLRFFLSLFTGIFTESPRLSRHVVIVRVRWDAPRQSPVICTEHVWQ